MKRILVGMRTVNATLLAVSVGADQALAQEKTADSDEELQKKLANPVADLISIPFQYTGPWCYLRPSGLGGHFDGYTNETQFPDGIFACPPAAFFCRAIVIRARLHRYCCSACAPPRSQHYDQSRGHIRSHAARPRRATSRNHGSTHESADPPSMHASP